MMASRFAESFAARKRPGASDLLREAVESDGNRLRALLASHEPAELSVEPIRTIVETNLWMLGPEAFRYFLPAFMEAALAHYSSLSVFVSELVGALTEPSRDDVVQALDLAAKIPGGLGGSELLRDQQLAWFDAGTPAAIFRDRVEGLTDAEGAAVLAFFRMLSDAHGADFPFDELQTAIDRRWGRYGVGG
jgi:hypothetical protein